MSTIVFGVVRSGRIVTEPALPEGTWVEVRPCDPKTEWTAAERAEFAAWEAASADALDLVEQLAREDSSDETR